MRRWVEVDLTRLEAEIVLICLHDDKLSDVASVLKWKAAEKRAYGRAFEKINAAIARYDDEEGDEG